MITKHAVWVLCVIVALVIGCGVCVAEDILYETAASNVLFSIEKESVMITMVHSLNPTLYDIVIIYTDPSIIPNVERFNERMVEIVDEWKHEGRPFNSMSVTAVLDGNTHRVTWDSKLEKETGNGFKFWMLGPEDFQCPQCE